MVALAVMTVVLGAVLMTFFRTSHQAERITDVADMRQSARTAVQLMEREVRMAGSGWGRLQVFGNTSTGLPDTLAAVSPGFGGATGNDSLKLVGAWQASTRIATGMPNASSILKVDDVTGFADGDLVIITDGSSAHMFQVTGVNASSENLQHNPSSPYNSPGGHSNWPIGGYGVGASVFKISITSYSFDATSYRRPALIRHEYGRPPQVVAYNVNGFHTWYELQDGTWTRSPANLSSIDKVAPAVLTRVTDSRLPALTDSVWAAVQPRTF